MGSDSAERHVALALLIGLLLLFLVVGVVLYEWRAALISFLSVATGHEVPLLAHFVQRSDGEVDHQARA